MTWNPDAPGEMLDRASLVFWELCGPAAYLNWLEKEVSRTKVHLEYKKAVVFSASTAGGASQPQHAMPPVAATSVASTIVDEMVDVLRWYADAGNYIREPGGSNRIAEDCGMKAQRLLVKYEAGKTSP